MDTTEKHSSSLRIKVCGMRPGDNLAAVASLRPDYVGFIFVPSSPRFVGSVAIDRSQLEAIVPPSVVTTGVFMNAEGSTIGDVIERTGIKAVQLHGDESPAFCAELRSTFPKLEILKAIRVSDKLPDTVGSYEGCVDLLIFDTASDKGGGSGRAFDWSILDEYEGATPYLVAGGIGPVTLEGALRACSRHEMFRGFDVNSAVEIAPGIKNSKLVEDVIRRCRHVSC